MLKTERNTEQVKKTVLANAEDRFKYYVTKNLTAFYEDGQWWVGFYDIELDEDRTYSVIDAEGIGIYGEFDFEEV